jgi:hypothetical protein
MTSELTETSISKIIYIEMAKKLFRLGNQLENNTDCSDSIIDLINFTFLLKCVLVSEQKEEYTFNRKNKR